MKLNDLFRLQQNLFHQNNNSDLGQRIRKIKKIRQWIKRNEKLITDTILKDYKKPITEIYTTEFKPVISHIDYTLRNLKKWASPKTVKTPLHLIGTKSKIYYEPKGICLIISPWNYPLNLTLNPLISSIAAGNYNIIKPSEFTPNLSELIKKMISELFNNKENIVVLGDHKVGEELINLPFNHIFFTGSPKIGKKVMEAAGKNLSSITLELGGKNHTIVDLSANLEDAVEKIIWSKYVNAGQTCIACNHVFIYKGIAENFYKEVIKKITLLNKDKQYTQIVNPTHAKRINAILSNCLNHSGKKLISYKNSTSQIIPIIPIKNVSIKNPILNDEIFGPILPIIEYEEINEVIKFIKSREKPLAIYLFSTNKKMMQLVLKETSSGGVVINDCMIQYMNPNLPFGGVNNSGIGKSGGKRSFLNFTNEKSVLIQRPGFSITKIFYPPYTNFKKKLAKKIPWLFN